MIVVDNGSTDRCAELAAAPARPSCARNGPATAARTSRGSRCPRRVHRHGRRRRDLPDFGEIPPFVGASPPATDLVMGTRASRGHPAGGDAVAEPTSAIRSSPAFSTSSSDEDLGRHCGMRAVGGTPPDARPPFDRDGVRLRIAQDARTRSARARLPARREDEDFVQGAAAVALEVERRAEAEGLSAATMRAPSRDRARAAAPRGSISTRASRRGGAARTWRKPSARSASSPPPPGQPLRGHLGAVGQARGEARRGRQVGGRQARRARERADLRLRERDVEERREHAALVAPRGGPAGSRRGRRCSRRRRPRRSRARRAARPSTSNSSLLQW